MAPGEVQPGDGGSAPVTGVTRWRQLVDLLAVAIVGVGAAWRPPPDALGALVLVALLAVVGRVGWFVVGWMLPREPLSSRVVAATLVAVAAMVLPALGLGALGVLYPGLWLGCVGGLGTAVAVLGRRRGAEVGPGAPGRAVGSLRTRRAEAVAVVVAVALMASASAVELWALRFVAPGHFQYDDLYYHLPDVAGWWQRHDLAMPELDMGDRAPVFYPVHGELVTWGLLAPFDANDVAARWAQLPFALATLAALVAVGRRIGVSRIGAALTALLFWSLERVFPVLSLGAGNDFALAFATLATVDALLAVTAAPAVGTTLYLGLAGGLLVGTKYLGVMVAPLLLPVLAAGLWRRPRGSRCPRPVAAALSGALLVAAVTGGFAYARNFVSTGNPVYPAPVNVGGHELFPGWAGASPAQRRQAQEAGLDLPRFLLDDELLGPATRWALPVAPVAALLVLIAAGHRMAASTGERLVQAAVLGLPVLLFAHFALVLFDHRGVRYVLAAVALAALAAGWLRDRVAALRPGLGAAATTAMAGFVPAQVVLLSGSLSTKATAAAILATAAATAGWWWWLRRSDRTRVRLAAAVLLVAGAVPTVGMTVLAEEYPGRKLDHEPVGTTVERLAGPGGATVAYVGWNTPYLLAGRRLQNRVLVVPTSSPDPQASLYRWGERPLFPFGPGERFELWAGNLQELGVRFVVVVREGFSEPERGWMVARPGSFRLLETHGDTEIWEVCSVRG